MATQSTSGPRPVLLTRPRAEALGFAGLLTLRFGDAVRPVVAPLMAPRFLDPDPPEGDFAAVIFTSAQGVAGARRLATDLPPRAFCVGRKTAEAARAAGFDAISADGNAEALVALIRSAPPQGRILHIHGVDTLGNIPERLTESGIHTQALAVYRQEAQPLDPEARQLLQGTAPVIVPLFSPRSARLLAAALPQPTLAPLSLVALSPAVAAAAEELPRAVMVVAGHPDAEGMLTAVGNLLAVAPPA